MRIHLLAIFLLQTTLTIPVIGQEKRIFTATRINESIQIDGVLDEPAWQYCDIASDFTELQPNPGREALYPSCIRVLYDDSGVYIGAEMDEGQIEHLGTELFERDFIDDSKNIDWFAVVIDCYQNGLSGYGFIVSASGVQTDIKFSPDSEDGSWDAVWDSDVHHYEHFWTCEMKIPYSALRFPDKEEQRWGIQFGRRSHQRQEETFWNPIDPAKDGFLPQAGILEGIRNIKPPVRLSLTPFLAVYAENIYDANLSQKSSWGTSYNGGMDVKYGISDAYTLDMTLIPDFGQVQSDNEVLNLSPFEVQFNENRQFFTEGTELFNRAGLFYSRRVGGTPYYLDLVYDSLYENEAVKEINQESRLINATKISGRGKNGLGIGYFNAISPRDHAVLNDSISNSEREVLLKPWTNYNIVVLDQQWKNHSYVSLINTNVLREGSARDANVTGVEFDLRDKANVYGIAGLGAWNQLWPGGEDQHGFKYTLEVAKNSGNITWEVGYDVLSDSFDPNDLGYLDNNNEKSLRGYIEYNQYEAKGPFLNFGFGTYMSTSSLYRFPGSPEDQVRPNLYTNGGMEAWFFALFKNYYYINPWFYMRPTSSYDYYEPRVEGRFFEYPAFKDIGINMRSDSRKKLKGGANFAYSKFHEKGKYQLRGGFHLNYRINNHFTVGYEFQDLYSELSRGYVNQIGDDIVFGARDYKDMTQVMLLNYTFTPKMTLSFRLRHNWTTVHYTHFYTLLLDGTIEDRVYEENEDINFNAWTIDTNFRWRFAPGSDIFFVWKNSIFGQSDQSKISYGENLNELFDNPQSNSFSVKAIYYIDFQRR